LPLHFPLQKASGANTQEGFTKGPLPHFLLQCQGFSSLYNRNVTATEAPLGTFIHNFPQYQVLRQFPAISSIGTRLQAQLKHSQANHSS